VSRPSDRHRSWEQSRQTNYERLRESGVVPDAAKKMASEAADAISKAADKKSSDKAGR